MLFWKEIINKYTIITCCVSIKLSCLYFIYSKFQQVSIMTFIIKNWCVHENLNSASTCKWSDISGTSDPLITIMQNKVFLSTYSTSLYCGLILEVYAIDYKYGF